MRELDVFALRDQLVSDDRHYAESITIKDDRIRAYVERELDKGLFTSAPERSQ